VEEQYREMCTRWGLLFVFLGVAGCHPGLGVGH
jgi:hypothetical protein